MERVEYFVSNRNDACECVCLLLKRDTSFFPISSDCQRSLWISRNYGTLILKLVSLNYFKKSIAHSFICCPLS